ncbi:unnamed protein product [Rotaria magnacalcarata]|uniref:Uncharacterized protein n=1 Tax=Rotaria magnacalcarata TaxID=392030 RepID=A0A816N2C8_9BILA|nr:unnamed protein product [Rotaria magnacalcarata]
MPSVIILDDNNDQSANITNSSFIQIYHTQSNENLFLTATVFNRTVSNSNLLFATIEMSNRSLYEIFPSISMSQTRSKRSFHYDYIVKHNGSILEQAFVSIEWRNNREQRVAQKSRSTNLRRIITSTIHSSIILRNKIKNRTYSLNKNKVIKPAHQNRFPKKTRPVYLEIIAVIDLCYL